MIHTLCYASLESTELESKVIASIRLYNGPGCLCKRR